MKLIEILKSKGTEVFSVDIGASVFDAIRIMVEKGIGSVVVMDGKRQIGIFTERDLMRRVCLNDLDYHQTAIEKVMTQEIIYGQPQDDVQYAINVMTTNRIRHLPVLEDGTLVGVISIGDLLKLQQTELEYENRVLKDYISDRYPG